MPNQLRLPSNWNTLSFNRKQWYLVETHQAANISEASVILSRRTRAYMLAQAKKVLATCQPEPIRMPYAD